MQCSFRGGHTRAIWDVSEASQIQYRMEVSGDGEEWQLFSEGTYRRSQDCRFSDEEGSPSMSR